ncbi:heavy metal translocating P-type ATPase [Desertifilum sp. FACHB-1129]|uniref:ATPase n=2 Tax=Desertifilum TaxID=1185872 RepID=A0A1E5QHD7_9CYAN|nr:MULTISPECIES: heavy metal translocating P-type ATPase [unclassified Desertifilum]MDA0213438.1 heavy metal translocating P-type ATPase [Cyanobacteria bacterium FC1]OEJ74014.1 ATPase [Desertifilum tharense IPPAS B-1220]MBD2314599.1 heavy metal translocating P-type ATPase [Desertifilum sp. FACHB-1129]MBD2322920.1 heavy metal translocating P-type ATPase [Desertifilum sp. FACHB-866]MBD2335169.1 heavy metal translocating P-type ATPase [Desertifilum sp. FACHB-868]
MMSSAPIRFSLVQLRQHPEAVMALVCALLVILGWYTLNLGWIGIALFILTVAYVVGGLESAREGMTTLIQEKELDVDLLMIVAALGAAGLGLWRREYDMIVDGAVLILIFAISGALEGYAMQHTERSIRGLMSLTVDTARLVRQGGEERVPVSALHIGDRVLVKPGELVPTDGRVVEGFSILNQASITGESIPVEKTVGDEVFAGTINGTGSLRIEIHQPPESSLIQRIIRLVQQAQTEAPPSQQFIERFERGYAKAIVVGGLFLGILPPFLVGWSWEETIYRALIFLVVASPCALMASIMPALLSGIANGARQGILFKNGAQLEQIGRVRAIAFDKTGTLTTGQLQVVDLFAPQEARLLQVAAALESLSEHPLGEAIVQAARQQGLTWPEAVGGQAQVGRGIAGEVEGERAIAGKVDFVQAEVRAIPPDWHQQAQRWESQGKTVVWVAQAGELLGLLAVADTLRLEAKMAIARLRQLGVEEIVMLTGDRERVARSIAEQLGVDRVYAELLPEDKVTAIRQLQKQYQTVAMVGDGINDAPALAQASVGIAMGTAGSDVALETADIVLMADRLEKLEQAIRLGRRAQTVVKQNITFAIAFVVLLLIANFVGKMPLPLGVLGHEGSTVAVTLSGLRLLRG